MVSVRGLLFHPFMFAYGRSVVFYIYFGCQLVYMELSDTVNHSALRFSRDCIEDGHFT